MIRMIGKPMTNSSIAAFDQIIFLKKGFSFWKHLVPFSIAALLLLILSLPADNLLIELVKILEQPGWIWIPVALLTVVAFGVYLVTMYVQVRKAYLWQNGVFRRSITTALMFIMLCALMAFGVLYSANPQPITIGLIWACFLLSVLSLTGIGWSGPDQWAESLGITSPDYVQARIYASDLESLLRKVRKKSFGTEADVKDFLAIANNLRDELEKNKSSEPDWAVDDIETVIVDIQNLIHQTERYFPTDKKEAVERFVTACNFQMDFHYPEFVVALKKVSNYLNEWNYSKGGKDD